MVHKGRNHGILVSPRRFPKIALDRTMHGVLSRLFPLEPYRRVFPYSLLQFLSRGTKSVTGEVQTQMSDRTLTCRDCGEEFTFTSGEQEFYTERGFSEPQRCPSCRQQRKAQRNQSGGGGYSSSGGGYGGNGGGGGYGGGGGQRQFHSAVCSECGQDTEVPFEPTPGKPVYCRDCFQARRSPRYSSY